MKDSLYYNYHIKINDLQEYEEYSCFSLYNKKYYFTKVKRDLKEISSIIKISEELILKSIPVFPIIKNIKNEYITNVSNDYYVLLEVTDENKEYDLESIIKRMGKLSIKPLKDNTRRDNWSELWTSKVDYMEYQVHSLGRKYPSIVNTFTYFKGLAENAICYFNHATLLFKNDNELKLSLCHKRISYPNIRLNYDNPLNFVIDYEIRDIASLLKSEMLTNKELALADLKYYLNTRKPTPKETYLLYARLLYPSYYFDEHERIINNSKDEKRLLEITDKITDIESFLKESYLLLNKYYPIDIVESLLQKES